MKKYCVALLSLFLINSVSAQDSNENDSKFYFGFKTGYTIPVAKSTVGSPRSEVGNRILKVDESGKYTFSEKNPFGSRGAGLTFAGNFGYMFNPTFGIEMEFSFLRSSRILDASKDETSVNGTNYFSEQHSNTNMFRAAPMLVVRANPNKKFVPYAKFGILLPLAGKTVVEVKIKDTTGKLADELLPVLDEALYNDIQHISDSLGINVAIPTDNYIKAKTAGSFSVGFAARMGVEYNISKNWSVFGELEFNMLTIKAKETKFTEFSSKVSDEGIVAFAETQLGREVKSEYGFSDLPEILKLTVYQNEITEASNSSYDPTRKNESFDQLTFRDNYNSFGIMLGFRYKFNNN